MTFEIWYKVFTMIVVLLGGAGTVGINYLDGKYILRAEPPPYDTVYVLIQSQNLKLLFDAQDELKSLQRKVANGTATSDDRERMATLRERIRNLQAG